MAAPRRSLAAAPAPAPPRAPAASTTSALPDHPAPTARGPPADGDRDRLRSRRSAAWYCLNVLRVSLSTRRWRSLGRGARGRDRDRDALRTE